MFYLPVTQIKSSLVLCSEPNVILNCAPLLPEAIYFERLRVNAGYLLSVVDFLFLVQNMKKACGNETTKNVHKSISKKYL